MIHGKGITPFHRYRNAVNGKHEENTSSHVASGHVASLH
ncbi:MAG: hypothetical protein XXXJIFNMEKO3_01870 [Candidatus Erwinia impunctatus]|nr:hypothetical protein XXXJIFNMEKO_01870 [Culicoides impunctatus]